MLLKYVNSLITVFLILSVAAGYIIVLVYSLICVCSSSVGWMLSVCHLGLVPKAFLSFRMALWYFPFACNKIRVTSYVLHTFICFLLTNADERAPPDEGSNSRHLREVWSWRVQETLSPSSSLVAAPVVLNLCPSEAIEEIAGEAKSNTGFASSIPFKNDHMVQWQKGILIGLRWIIYNRGWINL